MIKIQTTGKFEKTISFLEKSKKASAIISKALSKIGDEGAKELAKATPVDTGLTASSWNYEIVQESTGKIVVYWTNDNVIKGVNIAMILQYGHGTRNGGYVEGLDYINPALKPIFDKISSDMWEVVTK